MAHSKDKCNYKEAFSAKEPSNSTKRALKDEELNEKYEELKK